MPSRRTTFAWEATRPPPHAPLQREPSRRLENDLPRSEIERAWGRKFHCNHITERRPPVGWRSAGWCFARVGLSTAQALSMLSTLVVLRARGALKNENYFPAEVFWRSPRVRNSRQRHATRRRRNLALPARVRSSAPLLGAIRSRQPMARVAHAAGRTANGPHRLRPAPPPARTASGPHRQRPAPRETRRSRTPHYSV